MTPAQTIHISALPTSTEIARWRPVDRAAAYVRYQARMAAAIAPRYKLPDYINRR